MKAFRAAAALLLVLAVLTTSCTTDRISLRYGPGPGPALEYRLHLSAVITRTLSGDRREQRVEAAFRTRQAVLTGLSGGRARARISLSPESLVVDGHPSAPGPDQEFVVILAADGSVSRIESSSGAAPEALAPVGIDRLLPRLRPILPPGPVSPGDAWGSNLTLNDASGSLALQVSSRLSELGLADGRRAALIRSSYTSPVRRREAFANAIALVDGRDVGTQEAWFALDGFLVRANGDSVGDYTVTFSPPGGEAGTGTGTVTGRLLVSLHTEIELAG